MSPEIDIRNIDVKAVIEVVKPYEIIWNHEARDFKNKLQKAKTWKAIADELHVPVNVVKGKWKNIRDVFKKEIRKYPVSKVEDYMGGWKHFESAFFLFKPEYLESNQSDDETTVKIESDRNENTVHLVTEELSDGHDEFEQEPAAKRMRTEVSRIDDEFEEPATRTREEDYDMMFLKSLAPYLGALKPLRKLAIRNKIQELLLEELHSQESD